MRENNLFLSLSCLMTKIELAKKRDDKRAKNENMKD